MNAVPKHDRVEHVTDRDLLSLFRHDQQCIGLRHRQEDAGTLWPGESRGELPSFIRQLNTQKVLQWPGL